MNFECKYICADFQDTVCMFQDQCLIIFVNLVLVFSCFVCIMCYVQPSNIKQTTFLFLPSEPSSDSSFSKLKLDNLHRSSQKILRKRNGNALLQQIYNISRKTIKKSIKNKNTTKRNKIKKTKQINKNTTKQNKNAKIKKNKPR